MVDNGLMSLDPFSQLSLDPYSSSGNNATAQQQPQDNSNNNPVTPPQAPKTDNLAMTAGENVPGMYAAQQQQLMQVSPEQSNYPVQQPTQQQQQPVYSNYQTQQPQQQYPQATAQALASPPVSPLWADTTPNLTPPDGASGTMAPQAQNGMPPSLPTGYGAPVPGGAPVPTLSPSTPVQNPFDVFGAPAAAAPEAAAPVDPFAAASNVGGVPPAQAQSQEQNQQDDADFWNDMGFGNASPAAPANSTNQGNVTPTQSFSSAASDNSYEDQQEEVLRDETPVTLDERGLPVGGEYYNARVTTPMLGAIFSSGKELRSTLFKTASNSFVEAIGDRPVISFTIDGSAADTAGIGLGHVLLKVNGEDVAHTDEAVKMVGAAARPMTMEFYIPDKEVKVVKTEGQCMVKYDNHSTEAPASHTEWKPKYVVVGDMLGKPHILYMYRSKAEYDIAVKESQVRNRTLSVKVKQFDIRGARIFHERGTVQYPNKPRWYYFTVVRGQGLPIKISTTSPEALYPVYEGITTFLDKEMQMKRKRMEERRREQMTMYSTETYY